MYGAIPFLGFLMDKQPQSVTCWDFPLALSHSMAFWPPPKVNSKWISQQMFIWLAAPSLVPLRHFLPRKTSVQGRQRRSPSSRESNSMPRVLSSPGRSLPWNLSSHLRSYPNRSLTSRTGRLRRDWLEVINRSLKGELVALSQTH